MTQTRGHGDSEEAAKDDARKKADEDCGEGNWEQEGSWSCDETSPGYWGCDLWYHCK